MAIDFRQDIDLPFPVKKNLATERRQRPAWGPGLTAAATRRMPYAEGVTEQSPASQRFAARPGYRDQLSAFTPQGLHNMAGAILCNAFGVTGAIGDRSPGCAGRPATLGFAV